MGLYATPKHVLGGMTLATTAAILIGSVASYVSPPAEVASAVAPARAHARRSVLAAAKADVAGHRRGRLLVDRSGAVAAELVGGAGVRSSPHATDLLP